MTTKPPFLPFALPDIGEEEIAEVVDTLRSAWITTGPKTRRFEEQFAAFLGEGTQAIAVNSATAGLHLALEAAGVKSGDEVITTPHTFTATAEVICHVGADPVFVDVDPATFCIDPELIRRAVTPHTRALLPVHYGGRACDLTTIHQIARDHGLAVIEDAAHAFTTTHAGRLVGTHGSRAVVFSFYATKAITTGEGGMIVTRDADLARRCRVMRLHGIDRDAFDRYTSNVPSWYYEVVAPGFKCNMTDIAASLGLCQLRKARQFRDRREQIAARYDAELAGTSLVLPPRAAAGDVHSWHLYVVQLRPGSAVSRDEFVQRMFDEGVGCSVHYIPLYRHPYWRERYRLAPSMFPHTEAIYQRAVSLPIYTRMTDADQTRVIETLKRILG